MFYDIFFELCQKKGVKPSFAAEACGINRSNVSLWKSKGYTPRSDALNAIANYFGVSVDYLLENADAPKSERPKLRSIARLEDSELSPRRFDKLYNHFATHLQSKYKCHGGILCSPADLKN